MSESTDLVLVDRADGIVTLTLNRPERRNGLSGALLEAFIYELQQVAARPGDRVLVLTGAGGAFCSGMDLSEPVRPDELTFMGRVAHLCALLHHLRIPTIAKVRGAAVGFGCNLAIGCDFVLAGESATFGQLFAERGLSFDGAGTWSLPRRVGLSRAKQLAFLNLRLSGQEALTDGLADHVVADDRLDAEVQDWAGQLAAGPRRAMGMMKAALNRSYETAFENSLEGETVAQALGFRSPEAREGVQAFRERRPPDFSAL